MSGAGKKSAAGKKEAPKAAAKATKTESKKGAKVADPLYPAAPKNFRIGQSVQPKRNLSRFVRWPANVRLQRQKKILLQRLKTPPAINQFKKPFDRAEALPLFKLLAKYKPETKSDKKKRLEDLAKNISEGKTVSTKVPSVLKFGLNHITYLVEQKKAKLVVIATDVDPIELVVWLPALCRKMGVPYAIVNNKGRLGQLVGQKTAAAVALTSIHQEDNAALDKLIELANSRFADNVESRRRWGEGQMGLKTVRRLEKRDKMLAAEAAKKALL
jgi:large subunit ribosomal protein L7Ae